MRIEILEFAEGAGRARGLTVIIDVFRAFSVACYAYDAGAIKVIATGGINDAFELKKLYRNSVLAGERNEKKIEGFDYGNSPTEIIKADLTGKIMIHTTTAGTRGLLNTSGPGPVITGSLVNAGAAARFIRNINPEHVSLVAMGYRGEESADEDLLCAEVIESILRGTEMNFDKKISDLRHSSGNRFFVNENLDFSPPTDFFLCTLLNRFNFVLRAVRRTDGNIELEKIDV
jgi:2-phosphosulfolactate phosphatase